MTERKKITCGKMILPFGFFQKLDALHEIGGFSFSVQKTQRLRIKSIGIPALPELVCRKRGIFFIRIGLPGKRGKILQILQMLDQRDVRCGNFPDGAVLPSRADDETDAADGVARHGIIQSAGCDMNRFSVQIQGAETAVLIGGVEDDPAVKKLEGAAGTQIRNPQGNLFFPVSLKTPLKTQKGGAAVDQAVEFMRFLLDGKKGGNEINGAGKIRDPVEIRGSEEKQFHAGVLFHGKLAETEFDDQITARLFRRFRIASEELELQGIGDGCDIGLSGGVFSPAPLRVLRLHAPEGESAFKRRSGPVKGVNRAERRVIQLLDAVARFPFPGDFHRFIGDRFPVSDFHGIRRGTAEKTQSRKKNAAHRLPSSLFLKIQ